MYARKKNLHKVYVHRVLENVYARALTGMQTKSVVKWRRINHFCIGMVAS